MQNILLADSGHVRVTDFDLSYAKGTTKPTVSRLPAGCGPVRGRKGSKKKSRFQSPSKGRTQSAAPAKNKKWDFP